MTALTTCIQKFKDALPEADLETLERITQDYINDGHKSSVAAAMAVDDMLDLAYEERSELVDRIEDLGGSVDEVAYAAKKPGSDIGHRREASSGRYVGAPDWVGGSPQKLAALRKKLKKLAEEGESGRYWYEKSSKAVLDFVGGDKKDAEKFVALLAIYSQGTEVNVNMGFALEAYYQWKAGLPIATGRFPATQNPKAENILRHDRGWGGVKTNNFYSDLMEEIDPSKVDDDHATMGMWMALAFDYGSKVLDQGPKYHFAKREILRLGKELGWKPHQVQAAIWTSIKTRVEGSAGKRNKIEARRGIDPTNVKDRENGAYAHFRLAHKLGMELDISPEEISERGFDFSDSLNQRAIQMSWEATPSTSVEDVSGIHKATTRQKFEYLQAIQKALTGDQGQDLIAEAVNLKTPPRLFGISAWEGETGAGAQDFIPAPIKGTGEKRAVLPQARETLNLYAALRGLILKQDAVVWHIPIFSDAKVRHNGLQISTPRPLTEDEVRQLYQAIHDQFGTWELAPGYIENGVRVLNFVETVAGEGDSSVTTTFTGDVTPVFRDSDWNDTPLNKKDYSFKDGRVTLKIPVPEGKVLVAKLSNKAYQAGMDKVLDSLPEGWGGGNLSHAGYRSDGEYIGNNWKENPNGEEYQERIEAGRPDLLRAAADLRARVEAVNREFDERYGWGTGSSKSPAPGRSGHPRADGVRRDVGTGLPLDGRGRAPLTHWGRTPGRELIDPAGWGGAAAGREKSRVSPDFRGRNYYGLPGYIVETNVNTLARARYFTTLAPEDLYDWDTDLSGIRIQTAMNNPDLVGSEIVTAVENVIADSGYKGYWGNHPSGPIAVVFEPLAVEEVSRHGKVIERGGRTVAGIDGEGNLPEAPDSNSAEPKFKRTNQEPTSLSEVELGTIFDRIAPFLKRANGTDAPLVVVPTFEGLPQEIKDAARKQGSDGSDVYGVFHGGRIYLVQANMTSQTVVESTLFHEATHKGLGVLFGDKYVKRAMDSLMDAIGGTRGFNRIAAEAGVDLTAYRTGVAGLSTQRQKQILMEELLAHLGERGRPTLKQRAQEVIGAIRAWFRRRGFLALSELGVTDLMHLAKSAREAGLNQPSGRDTTRFMVAYHGTPHTFDAFDEWFGNSKVIDENGNPLIVYHGTRRDDIEKFYQLSHFGTAQAANDRLANTRAEESLDNIGINQEDISDPNSYEVWDDDELVDSGLSEDAATQIVKEMRRERLEEPVFMHQGEGYNIIPAYLSIQNPAVITDDGGLINAVDLSKALVEAGVITEAEDRQVVHGTHLISLLESKGYDGLMYKNSIEGDGEWSYVALRPEQVKSINNQGTFDPKDPRIMFSRRNPEAIENSTIRDSVRTRMDTLRYWMQDQFIDIKRKQEEVQADPDGSPFTDAMDVYQKLAIYDGRTGDRLDRFDENRVQPLMEQIAETGLDLTQVGEWLHARHAREANAYLASINPDMEGPDRYRLSGMSNEQAEVILADHADNQALQLVGDLVDVIGREKLAAMVRDGLITQDQAEAMNAQYEHYVPLIRGEVQDGTLPSRGKGFNLTKSKETKRRVGNAHLDVTNIIANLIEGVEKSVVRGEKNRVLQSLLNLVNENPDDSFWKVDEEETRRIFDERQGKVVERNPFGMLAPNQVVVKVDGEPHIIAFNKDNPQAMRMAKALQGMDKAQIGRFVGIFQKINRYLAAINTSLSPEFVISNFARDMQTAGYNLSDTELSNMEGKVLKRVMSAMAGIKSALRGNGEHEWASTYEDFKAHGGKTGWISSYDDPTSREHDLSKILTRLQAGKNVRNPLQRLGQFIDDYNTVVENAVRLSAYRTALEEVPGMTKERAAALAKDLTVNFNRKGAIGSGMNAFYLFYNASVQGSVRLLQAMVRSKKGRKLAAGTIALAVVLDIINRANAGDDDDGENLYDALPDYVKNHYFIIMGEKEPIFKFPLPWGYNVLHAIGQSIGSSMTQDRFSAKDAAARVASAAVDAFNPVGSGTVLQTLTPTVMDPIVQIAENKDFAGRPLKPEHTYDSRAPRPEHLMHWSSAREPSKDLARWLNSLSGGNEFRPGEVSISPEHIDLLIDTMTGSAGRVVSDTGNLGVKLITGEDIALNEIPMARKLYGYQNTFSLKSRYYENSLDMEYTKKELKSLKGEALAEARKRPQAKLVLRYKLTEKRLRKWRKDRRELIKNDAAPEKIEQVEDLMRQEMARFNRLYVEKVYR